MAHLPRLNPEDLDRWFLPEQQRHYVSVLLGRIGLTRRRAECFVRLWAYLLLKQQLLWEQSSTAHPIEKLTLPDDFIPCTHREAAILFYAQKERGSERSAGMMIDKLSALGLVNKQFDGNTLCLQIHPSLNLHAQPAPKPLLDGCVDAFNPRTDAIPVATFLARNYNWMNQNTDTLPQNIARWLRLWAQQYDVGMRVLRRNDNLNPVGFFVLYPIAAQSEDRFFMAPTKSLHLCSAREIDPIAMAQLGDMDCNAVFIRSWMLDPPYNQKRHKVQLLKDTQQTLKRLRQDFPNVCDLYALMIHPSYEELIETLGFQKTYQDPLLSIYWAYIAIDRFLELDVEQKVEKLSGQ
jgi:hypothetical protein